MKILTSEDRGAQTGLLQVGSNEVQKGFWRNQIPAFPPEKGHPGFPKMGINLDQNPRPTAGLIKYGPGGTKSGLSHL